MRVTGVSLGCLPLSAAIFKCGGAHGECHGSVLWREFESACPLDEVSLGGSSKGYKVHLQVPFTATRTKDSYGNKLEEPVVTTDTATAEASIVTYQTVTSLVATDDAELFVTDAYVALAVVNPAKSRDGDASAVVTVNVVTNSDIHALELRPGSTHEGEGELLGEPTITSVCEAGEPRCTHTLIYTIRAPASSCDFSGITSLLLRALCAFCDHADIDLQLDFTSMHAVEYCMPDINPLAGKGVLYVSADKAIAAPGSPASITFLSKVVHEEGTHASPALASSLKSVRMYLPDPKEHADCTTAGGEGYLVVDEHGASKSPLVSITPANDPNANEHVVTLTVASSRDDFQALMMFAQGNEAAKDAFVESFAGRVCVEMVRYATLELGGSRRLSAPRATVQTFEVNPVAGVGIQFLGIDNKEPGGESPLPCTLCHELDAQSPPASPPARWSFGASVCVIVCVDVNPSGAWDTSLNVHMRFPVQGVKTGDMAVEFVADADIDTIRSLVTALLATTAGLPVDQVVCVQIRFVSRPAPGEPAQVEASFAFLLLDAASDELQLQLDSLTSPVRQHTRRAQYVPWVVVAGGRVHLTHVNGVDGPAQTHAFRRGLAEELTAHGLGHIGDPDIALERTSDEATEAADDGDTMIPLTVVILCVAAVVILLTANVAVLIAWKRRAANKASNGAGRQPRGRPAVTQVNDTTAVVTPSRACKLRGDLAGPGSKYGIHAPVHVAVVVRKGPSARDHAMLKV